MKSTPSHTAFAGTRQLAHGSLRDVLAIVKERFDRSDGVEPVLVFEIESGRQVDFDLRGSPEEVFARAMPPLVRGPGRPKLGVTSREVTLFPAHWDWLEQQESGISGALRRLVDRAMKAEPGKERAKRRRAALSRILTGIAGDRPNFEEATRALFRGDVAQFEQHVRRWPKDIRCFAIDMARAAADPTERT